MGVTWLLYLTRHLHVIGVCFGEDQRTNTIEMHVTRDWTKSSYFITTRHSIVNTIEGPMHSVEESTNMHSDQTPTYFTHDLGNKS